MKLGKREENVRNRTKGMCDSRKKKTSKIQKRLKNEWSGPVEGTQERQEDFITKTYKESEPKTIK